MLFVQASRTNVFDSMWFVWGSLAYVLGFALVLGDYASFFQIQRTIFLVKWCLLLFRYSLFLVYRRLLKVRWSLFSIHCQLFSMRWPLFKIYNQMLKFPHQLLSIKPCMFWIHSCLRLVYWHLLSVLCRLFSFYRLKFSLNCSFFRLSRACFKYLFQIIACCPFIS